MKNKHQKRQGDVLIVRVSDTTAKSVKDCKPSILAHGEVTGHAHAIERGAIINEQASLLDVVDAVVSLQHQEHWTIDLDRGQYRVIRQQQYKRGAIQKVQD